MSLLSEGLLADVGSTGYNSERGPPKNFQYCFILSSASYQNMKILKPIRDFGGHFKT